MIPWSTGPSLVEFGIISEVGPYFSSMFIGATETRLEVRQKTSLMRKHGEVDFPLCVCRVSINAVMKEWAVGPWRPDRLEDRRKPPHSPIVSFLARFTKLNCLSSAKDHSVWRQALKLSMPLKGKGKKTKRKGKDDT